MQHTSGPDTAHIRARCSIYPGQTGPRVSCRLWSEGKLMHHSSLCLTLYKYFFTWPSASSTGKNTHQCASWMNETWACMYSMEVCMVTGWGLNSSMVSLGHSGPVYQWARVKDCWQQSCQLSRLTWHENRWDWQRLTKTGVLFKEHFFVSYYCKTGHKNVSQAKSVRFGNARWQGPKEVYILNSIYSNPLVLCTVVKALLQENDWMVGSEGSPPCHLQSPTKIFWVFAWSTIINQETICCHFVNNHKQISGEA